MEKQKTLLEILSTSNEIETLFEQKRNKRERVVESYGSFRGQFDIAEDIASKITSAFLEKKFFDDGGELKYDFKYPNETVGDLTVHVLVSKTDDGAGIRGYSIKTEQGLEITLKCPNENEKAFSSKDLQTVIAHEIMHCFQDSLPKLRGVNERSTTLYYNLIRFYDCAPNTFSYVFFYGLYCCFAIEANANVSSVSNYIGRLFKGLDSKSLSGENYNAALLANRVYRDYITVRNIMKNSEPTEEDKKYIQDCLTTPMKSPYNGDYVRLYDVESFDVNKFISANRRRIERKAEETIQRMQKNVVNYIDTEKR